MKKVYVKKMIIPLSLALILILTLFGLKTNKTNKSIISAEINGFKLEQNSRYGTVKIVSYDKESKYIKAAESGHKFDKINNMVIPEAVEIESDNYDGTIQQYIQTKGYNKPYCLAYEEDEEEINQNNETETTNSNNITDEILDFTTIPTINLTIRIKGTKQYTFQLLMIQLKCYQQQLNLYFLNFLLQILLN